MQEICLKYTSLLELFKAGSEAFDGINAETMSQQRGHVCHVAQKGPRSTVSLKCHEDSDRQHCRHDI